MHSSLATCTSRMHSGDRYVRLRQAQLPEIAFEHLATVPDEGVLADAVSMYGPSIRNAGLIEWTGSIRDCLVYLAWDWAQLACGDVRVLTAVGPRSNVCLIDHEGYDLPQPDTSHLLLNHAKTLHWQRHVC